MQIVNETKLQSFRTSSKYKCGFKVPHNHKQSLKLDSIVGNHLLHDANILKHKKLSNYNVFLDKGKYCKRKITSDYKEIHIHTLFDVKYDKTPSRSSNRWTSHWHPLGICLFWSCISTWTLILYLPFRTQWHDALGNWHQYHLSWIIYHQEGLHQSWTQILRPRRTSTYCYQSIIWFAIIWKNV